VSLLNGLGDLPVNGLGDLIVNDFGDLMERAAFFTCALSRFPRFIMTNLSLGSGVRTAADRNRR
jgi:hypothetical protein